VQGGILNYESFLFKIASDGLISRPGAIQMIVCVCQRISDRDIERHARNGCASFDELQMDSGVSSCCGRCTDCARDVFESARSSSNRPHAVFALVPVAA
jgi:bacterioferritin-associated ferredoxin